MPLLRHLLLLVSYTALATGVAASLPYSTLSLSLEASYGVAALIFLTGAALHEGVARRWSEEDIRRQLYTLARAGHIRERDISELGIEISRLRENVSSLRTAFHQPKKDSELNPHVLTLRDEVHTAGDLAARVLRATPDPSPRSEAPPISAVPLDEPPVHLEDPPARQDVGQGEIIALVREAVAEDRIHTVTQPIVSLPQRKPCFREQFTRLRLPDGEALEAERYVELAEREGLITSIDNFQVFRAAQVAREAIRRRRNEAVFVNLSRHTIKDREFVSRFIEFLSTNAELCGRLIFEFSAADLDLIIGPLRSPLDYLAQRGFRYSLDGVEDMGSLPLRKLSARHFRYIKVHADLFLRQADMDIGAIDFADFRTQLDSSAIDLVVSHIETEQTLLNVLDHRVDFGQGHLFGEPM